MISHRFLALASILPLTLACQTAHAAPSNGAPQAARAGLLPPARTAIELRVDGEASSRLDQVLQQLSASTGVTFTASELVRQMLSQSSCGVLANVSVPPAQAWQRVESMLEQEGFHLGLLSADDPWLVAVYSTMNPGGRPGGQRVATTVTAARLEALAEHPALLVTTTLDLPHTDVRQLGNSLRGLTTDPTGQQNVVPVGNTNSVILTGTGRNVHQLAKLLLEVEAREAAAQERRAKEAGETGAQGEGGAR